MRSAVLIGLTLTLVVGAASPAVAAAPKRDAGDAARASKAKRAIHHTKKQRIKAKRLVRAAAVGDTTLVGNSSMGSLADSQPSGEASAFPFTASTSGDVSTLSLYVDSANAATNLTLGVYTDASGRPGTLLVKGAKSAPTRSAWNSVAVTATSVVAGRKYWIALLGTGGSLAIRDSVVSGCTNVASSTKTLTTLPSTYPSGLTWNACNVSAYGAGAAAATPPPPPPPPPPAPVPSGDCTLNATPSTLASVFSAAGSGSVICLASGSYDTFAGGSKAGMVTIKPAAGATPSFSIALGTTAKNIRFDGFTDFGGWDLNGSQNIEIVNTDFTYPMNVRGATSGILFDNVTFYNLPTATWEGRLSMYGAGGVTVRNSRFGKGGCSDGIQMVGGTNNVLVQGNTFDGIRQGSCSPRHTDPIQFYGAKNITVVDNLFINNSTGIMSPDGNGSPVTIKNNVFVMFEYAWAYVGGGTTSSTVAHNVVTGGSLMFGLSHQGVPSTGNVVRDNVSDLNLMNDHVGSVDHNVLPSSVQFVGGAGRCAYKLAATSAGRNAASDGTDIGLNDCP